MKHARFFKLGLLAAILTPVTPHVFGQEVAPQAQSADAPSTAPRRTNDTTGDTAKLDTVIVTASPVAGGVKKLEASFSVTTANAEQIKQSNAKSTADLLKAAPGVWAEASGGQTGANIFVAGFPASGDAAFFTTMINGSPLYGAATLSFMETSSMMRLDDTVERVEIVQGGPAATFGPGQMGATANFILKQGSDTPSGSLGVTYGNEGLYRVDAFYGSKVAEGWYASIGGFARVSNGVRDPQFKADSGGQITATLTHDLDNGSLMFWARKLDDKNQFIVPVALIQTGAGKFTNYPGFDAGTSTYFSRALQHISLPNPAGGMESADLANGRGANMNFFGVNFDNDFNGWKVSDTFLYSSGSLNTNALFSGANPQLLSDFLTSYVSYNAGQPLVMPAGGTWTTSVPTSTTVISQGWWYIQKQLKNTTNDLRVSKELFKGNTLTAGLYLARYTDDDNWSLGNQVLMTNTPNASPVTLSYMQGGTTYNVTSPQGLWRANGDDNYNIIESGTATNTALYLSDSWKIGPWLMDASGRTERTNVRQQTCNRAPQRLGGVNDLYNNAVKICDGTWDYEHYTASHPTFSIGANYTIDSNMSVYGRANTGAHFNSFDDIRGAGGNFSPLQKVKNVEGGFKYSSKLLYVDVSVYQRLFTGLAYQPTSSSGVNTTGPASIYGANTHGMNLVATLSPIENLKLTLSGNYMDGKYTHREACNQYTDINGNAACASFNGNPLQRQPKMQYRFMPSYKIATDWGDVTGWLNYEHVGNRYSDQTALQELGSYYMLGAGVLANVGKNWEVRVQGTNLTNQIAITEGNARVTGSNLGAGGVILGRPIEGREVNVGLKYKF